MPIVEVNNSGQRKRPVWFQRLWDVATADFQFTSHEEILEAALGIGRLIDEGEYGEAQRLTGLVHEQIIRYRQTPQIPGETQSTQIIQMIEDGQYPIDLREVARRFYQVKYPSASLR